MLTWQGLEPLAGSFALSAVPTLCLLAAKTPDLLVDDVAVDGNVRAGIENLKELAGEHHNRRSLRFNWTQRRTSHQLRLQ